MQRLRWWSVCLVIGALMVGTSSTEAAKRGYVMNEWSTQMRQLGIVPIFPPREDVHVGDLYVYHTYRPDSKETERLMKKGDYRIGIIPRWSRLKNVVELVDGEYRTIISLPSTPAPRETPKEPGNGKNGDDPKEDPCKGENGEDPKKKPGNDKPSYNLPIGDIPQPNTGDDPIFRADCKPNRLRMTAFPEFMSATFSQGNLSALIPIEAINLALGAGWSRSKAVTLKVPYAESYGISGQKAFETLFEQSSTGKYRLKKDYYPTTIALLVPGKVTPQQAKDGIVPNRLWIRVITEVFYARSLDIGIESKRASGARLSVTPVTIQKTDEKGNTTTVTIQDPAAAAVARATVLNEYLKQSGLSSTIGGSAQYVTASDASISMRRTWERPVAIGIRGYLIEIDTTNGEIVTVQPTTGPDPAVVPE